MEKEEKYGRGKHPNSLANLTSHKGRPRSFDTPKKKRNIYVTQEGWEGLNPVLQEAGCKSVSELLEKLGRGWIKVSA